MRDQAIREYLQIGYAVGTYLRLNAYPQLSAQGGYRFEDFKVRVAQYGTRENVYGRMKQTDELSVFELYYMNCFRWWSI